jgi:CheY-like chemotaxis protein
MGHSARRKTSSATAPSRSFFCEVLLATAHAMSGDRERLLESSGADGYLQKPVYDSAQLVAKVRQRMA